MDGQRYHDELGFRAAQRIFVKESRPDCFFVVLKGAVANRVGSARAVYRQRQQIVSGAGPVELTSRSRSNLMRPSFLSESSGTAVGTLWPVGGVFGYSDMLLERPRTFGTVAALNLTRVARINRSHLNLLHTEDASWILFSIEFSCMSVYSIQQIVPATMYRSTCVYYSAVAF